MRVPPRIGRNWLHRAIVRVVTAVVVGIGPPVSARGLGDFIVDSWLIGGHGRTTGALPRSRLGGFVPPELRSRTDLMSATGAVPAAAGFTNFTNSFHQTDLTTRAHGTGHLTPPPGGPRARAHTLGGHPRRSPLVTCAAESRGTCAPAPVMAAAEEVHGPRPDTTTALLTAADSPATAPTSAAAHRDTSVCIRAPGSFTAAAPRR